MLSVSCLIISMLVVIGSVAVVVLDLKDFLSLSKLVIK